MSLQQYNVYEQLTSARVVSLTNVSGTYNNGNSNNGVGASITVAASSLTIDSVVLDVGNRVLLQGQTAKNENGIYIVYSIGSTVVLQRSADFQNIEQLKAGQFIAIAAGTVNAGSAFVLIEPLPATFGVSDLLFLASPLNAALGTAAAKAASDNTKASLASVAAATTSGNIAVFNDTAGTVANGAVAGNKVLTSSITTPNVGANLVSFDVTVGQAALAAGGSVTLYASTAAKQFKIRTLELESGGTNFSGGGGDRLGQVTDGTTVYSVVPAATMQSLVNARWGVTALPNAAAAANNTSTVAGASLVFKYSGGAADYTAGSLVISGVLERIA